MFENATTGKSAFDELRTKDRTHGDEMLLKAKDGRKSQTNSSVKSVK
jgi:hypothetical protein